MTAPDPPIGPETDIGGFPKFMLNADRLLASELVALATPEEGCAALMLWCRAWKQTPPASLPNDDRVLASFSRAGSRWQKVREMALRGFVLCSDGRLYHPVLVEEAIRASSKRDAYKVDQERLRKWRSEQRERRDWIASLQESERAENADETPDETHFKQGSETLTEMPLKSDDKTRQENKRKKDTPLMPPQGGEASDGELFVCERSGKAAKATKPPRRRAVIPDGFEPDAAGWAYAASLGATRADFAAFTNHHRGKGSVMADWQHAWRTWCDRVPKFAGTGAPRQPAERAPVNGVMAMLLKRKAEAARRTITPDYPMLEGQPDDATH